MDYPEEFSAQARNKIEAERLKASRRIVGDRCLPSSLWMARTSSLVSGGGMGREPGREIVIL